MDKTSVLREKAGKLRALLEKYAKDDDEVQSVLGFMRKTFSEIESGKISPPHRDEFRWHFFSTESPLFLKYDDLSKAEAEYAEILEGWT